jgi:hypothetical protein
MMEAARTSETSVDNHFTRQYNPEDCSEHHTRRRENLKSHKYITFSNCPQKDSDTIWHKPTGCGGTSNATAFIRE